MQVGRTWRRLITARRRSEAVLTSQAGTQKRWSVLARSTRGLSLGEVRDLDRDAVRMCDGFEFRYYSGGRVTWFSLRSREELGVLVLETVPTDRWQHLPGCDCEACCDDG